MSVVAAGRLIGSVVGVFAFVTLVGLDDALHQRVAHDVFLAKFHSSDTGNILEHLESLNESRFHCARQVYLGGVAGDNHFGVHAQAGEEHLDLVDSGVLGLVEHDDGVVECASAHEGQRGNLYGAPLHVFLEFDGRNHVLERVIEGLEIGVDLVFHVAGQETEFLTCLDGRAREYDLAHLLVLEGLDGERYGDISLACAGGAQSEGQIVLAEALDKQGLIVVARRDRFAVDAVDYHVVMLWLIGGLSLDDVEDHFFGELVVARAVVLEFLDFLFKLGCLGLVAYDLDDRASCGHAQLREEVAYKLHVGVVDTIEADRIDIVDYNDTFYQDRLGGLGGCRDDNLQV